VRVLVIGSGGREHALVWRLRQDPDVSEVIAAPGNPGMAALGSVTPVDILDPAAVLALAERERIDLTVVGPEAPLEKGLADVFRAGGRRILGPSRVGAALECSKVHAKHFMARHQIPTARFVVCEDAREALAVSARGELGWPLVVKADGLAAGKGVVIAAARDEAEAAIRSMMIDRQFGASGARVVLEECLTGHEASFFVLCDGERARVLGTAQDHKRIFDDDRGPNTGGMGAFAPSPLMTPAIHDRVMTSVVERVLDGIRAEGDRYIGFLYVGLMLTARGPMVIEFNVRFGDPEAEVVLPGIDGPLASVFFAAAGGELTRALPLAAHSDRFVGVVLASRGYPATSSSGDVIDGLDRAAAMPGVVVFHAGTRADAGGRIVTAGGRVLTVVGRGPTFERAMTAAYAAAGEIRFDGMQYRRDIGRKALAASEVG